MMDDYEDDLRLGNKIGGENGLLSGNHQIEAEMENEIDEEEKRIRA